MDAYDELGVTRDASEEQIRQAYKTLVRLLHPDRHEDANLKAAAERQMRRLNELAAMLADPERRAQYDRTLDAPIAAYPAPGEAPPQVVRRLEHSGFWAAMAAVSLIAAAVWLALPPRQAPPRRTPEPQLAPGQNAATSPAPAMRRNPLSAPSQPVRAEWKPAPAQESALPLLEVVPEAPVPFVPPAALPAAIRARPAPPEAPSGSEYTGYWLAAQGLEEVDHGSYPAVYVELNLTEESGALTGSYRARYRVPDKAIPAEVALRLRGQLPLGRSGRVNWESGRARGVLQMSLRSPGLMSVSWWATELGAQPGLVSGSAMLVRQQVQ
jgi:hypothetical protein